VDNPYLTAELRKRGLWNPLIIEQINKHNGCLKLISDIPDDVKCIFKTAFEMDATSLLNMAHRLSKWVDQTVDRSLFIRDTSTIPLTLYNAWMLKLKDGCYSAYIKKE